MKKTITIFILFLLVSCLNENEQNDVKNPTESSPFEGVWEGSFSGNDEGTVTVKVFHDGNVSGASYSTKYNESHALSGAIDDMGKANITIGKASTGASFKGQFTTNMVASGTWENDWIGWSGTWTANKKPEN